VDLAELSFDTIFAVASGGSRAAVAIMRVSGPGCGRVLDTLCHKRPPPRVASLRPLRSVAGELLDRALVLWFPRPHSYTGEDSVELHLHGGRAVTNAVADALVGLGCRPAEAGEFTRRAFLNGRMDLLEAEAVADLVEAETTAQRAQALRQLDGALGQLMRGWSARLVALLAQMEAVIDFPDEDLPPGVEADVLAEITTLGREITTSIDDDRRGERLREGLVFAITGRPNVGKSTLVNALAEREVAIVASTPGTTRDILEARVDLGGVPVTLLDTAGVRESDDPVEAEGVRRAMARAAEADAVVVVLDATEAEFRGTSGADDRPVVHVVNKIDISGSWSGQGLGVSALTGEGLEDVRRALCGIAEDLTRSAGPAPLTRARHRAALIEAAERLRSACIAVLPELRAEDLRLALRAIGRVTGVVGVEEILGSVFRQFCIGK